MIIACIGLCPRGFAKHIIGIGKALGLHPFGAFHRLVDIFTQDKLATHFAHGTTHRSADHRLAQAFDRPAQVPRDARLFVVQHTTRQHQRPSGGIDQRRGGMAQMLAPIRGRDFILDQRVDRVGVGNPQQGFGQTHQGDTLVGGQPVFGQKDFHQARLGIAANLAHQIGAFGANARTIRIRQGRSFAQPGDACGLIGVECRIYLCAQRLGSVACHGRPL